MLYCFLFFKMPYKLFSYLLWFQGMHLKQVQNIEKAFISWFEMYFLFGSFVVVVVVVVDFRNLSETVSSYGFREQFSDQRQECHLSFPTCDTVLFLQCTALFAKYPSSLSPSASDKYYYPYITDDRLLKLFACTFFFLSMNLS